jgi:hypothetical protein
VAGVDTKIKIKCKKCNKSFMMTPYEHTAKSSGCSRCNKSIGELKIERFLDTVGVAYEPQKKFPDCKNIAALPFDFAILKDDGVVKGLIEFNGAQHYRAIKFGKMTEEKAIENFKGVQIRDSIKREYCKNNAIPLLEIHYSDIDNIQTILQQFLRSLDDFVESL